MKTQEAKELLQQILEAAGFTIVDIEIDETEGNEFSFNIHSDDNPHLIGRNGDVIRSLQSLVKNVFRNQGVSEENDKIKIDVDSYRSAQEQKVLEMAETRAQRVVDSGRLSVLPPMSPFFRRLVHLHIKDKYPQLETYSKGSLSDRSVCIDLPESERNDTSEVAPDLYAEIEF
jgi:spoIIIJ-associated protein